jgi:hypothetical protein
MKYRKEGKILKAIIPHPVKLGSFGYLWSNENAVSNYRRHAKKHGVNTVDVYVQDVHAWRLTIDEYERCIIDVVTDTGLGESDERGVFDFDSYLKGREGEEHKD